MTIMDSKHSQNGGVATILLIPSLIILLGGSLAFGIWANSSREDYKNNVDAKIAVAVSAAKQQQTATDSAQFAQEAKNPLRAYDGPEAYGSLVVNYPKTWSAYVDDTGAGGTALVDGYFAPGTVPSITAQGSVFALRVQVLSQSYNQTVQNFSSQQQNGQLSVQVYSLPKVPKAIGVEVSGMLPSGQTGTMVVLPLRNETVEIWTEGTSYLSDFNTIILPNFSFLP